MHRFIAALALACALASAQNQTPDVKAETERYYYDGSNYLEYVCKARIDRPANSFATTFSIDATTLVAITDSSNTSTVETATAHGYVVGQKITISGETGDADLNGTYVVLTVPTSTTFTITTASVTDDTYNASGLQITSDVPLETQAIWTVQRLVYDASYNWIHTLVTRNPGRNICANRTTLTYF